MDAVCHPRKQSTAQETCKTLQSFTIGQNFKPTDTATIMHRRLKTRTVIQR